MTESQSPKSGSLFDIKWNETDEIPSAAEYRTLSIPCLLALLLGLLSSLVLIHWGFVFIPVFAVVFAAVGLVGIANSDGMKFGKPLAWSAVFLSICFVIINVTLWETYKSRVTREAIEFAGSYFEIYNRSSDDEKLDLLHVQDMRIPYWQRSVAPLEDRWKALDKDMMAQEDMSVSAEALEMRTLMALGNRAVPTYYSVKSYMYDTSTNIDYVAIVYAVTYETDTKEKETFFLELTVKRMRGEDTTTIAKQKKKLGGWAVHSLKKSDVPKELEGRQT